MRHAILPLFCACALLLLPSSQERPEDRELYDEVRLFMKANLEAVRSISYDYVFDWGATRIDARYARDGAKLYQASIITGRDGTLSMPAENAWDGSRHYGRTRFMELRLSGDRNQFHVTAPVMHEQLLEYMNLALRLIEHPRITEYRLKSARELEAGKYVELTFSFAPSGGELVTTHDREANCMPIGSRLSRADGTLVWDLSEVEYAEVTSGGNLIYIPKYFKGVTAPALSDKTRETTEHVYRLDIDSLRVNEPIPHERFVLSAWPGEEVHDFDTGRWTRAADPEWNPAGKVGFPFDEFALRVSMSTGGTLKAPSTEPETLGLSARGAMHKQPEYGRATWPWWFAGAAAAVGAGVIVLIWRRKA